MHGILELEKGGIIDMGWQWDSVDQWTGLLDLHGVEIYEGDIVRLKGIDISGSRITSVIFHDGAFCENYFKYSLNSYKEYEREVIGNIYENPELLKGGER